MCVRVRPCVCAGMKGLFGWGRVGAETVRHSAASKRGRRDTKVSVCKTHSYDTSEGKKKSML